MSNPICLEEFGLSPTHLRHLIKTLIHSLSKGNCPYESSHSLASLVEATVDALFVGPEFSVPNHLTLLAFYRFTLT